MSPLGHDNFKKSPQNGKLGHMTFSTVERQMAKIVQRFFMQI